jgi:hypothetical protein
VQLSVLTQSAGLPGAVTPLVLGLFIVGLSLFRERQRKYRVEARKSAVVGDESAWSKFLFTLNSRWVNVLGIVVGSMIVVVAALTI